MQQNKVLVTATTFPRWENDATPSFVYDLSERLSTKHKIIVLAPHHKGAKKYERLNNLDIRRFAYFKPESLQKLCYGAGIIPNMKNSSLAAIQMPLLIISEFFASSKIIKKEKIQMIHAHWMLPQGFIGIFLKKIFKIPILVTIHGSDLFPLKSKFFQKIQLFVINNADFVTVNSPAAKNELLRRFPQYSSKIKIIPMGIDTNLFKKRIVKKPLKYSKNRLLLFVGRLNDQKGLQYLMDAMPLIVQKELNITLLIIGEGEFKKSLIEKANSNNVEHCIEFLGSLPHKELAFYYNIADIFIMPSLSNKTGTESLGLALIEAMSSGCVVIGTNVGGIPYIIKNNKNGILVKQKDSSQLANAVIALLKNPQKCKKLGKSAAQSAKKFSWNNISKNFSKIYFDLLK